MPMPTLLAPPKLRRVTSDPLREAVERLGRELPARADAEVLLDFLEDDLREGLDALGDVEAHFTDVLDTLRGQPLSPVALLEAGDDARVLQRLEYLHLVITHLRRRLSQAAGMLRHG